MIAAIQNRLRTAQGTPFALVEGAVSLAALKDRPTGMPAAFVIPVRAASSPNQRATGAILQKTESDVGVVIIFENLSTPLYEDGADELESLYRFVREQLVGFAPSDDEEPLQHIDGELVKARGGVVWWQETFGTAHYQESKE